MSIHRFFSLIFTVLLSASCLSAATFSSAAATDTYTKTQYPIVLVYGILGFDKVLGVDYFYGIAEALRAGGAEVYVANIQQLNTNEYRGEQLLSQVQKIIALSGKAKVNLIGHDQGGSTARYVAAVRPDLVASVTAIGSPVKGSPVADLIRVAMQPGSPFEQQAALIIDLLGNLISLLSTQPDVNLQNSIGALDALSIKGAATFNQKYPAAVPATSCGEGAYVVNNVHYYSLSGTATKTNAADASDAVWAATGLIFLFTPNDGFVSQCGSHLGKVIRDNYIMNHYDEINMLFGLVSDTEVSPTEIYRQLANRLKLDAL